MICTEFFFVDEYYCSDCAHKIQQSADHCTEHKKIHGEKCCAEKLKNDGFVACFLLIRKQIEYHGKNAMICAIISVVVIKSDPALL